MVRLKLTRALAAQAGEQLEHHVDAATIAGALNIVIDRHPLLRRYLLDDNGRLREHVNIFLNDTLIDDRHGLSDAVAKDDTISVLQAVSGG